MTIFIGDVRLDDYVDAVDESLFFHSTTPKRVYEEVTIPGRDGVLHLDQKRFEPYTLSIPVYFRHDFKDRYRRLLNFLNSLVGTVKLRCTPAPALWGEGHYDGIFYGAIPAPDTGAWVHSGTVTLQFQCNPRWWLKIGEEATAPMLFVTARSNTSDTYATANFTYHTGDTLAVNCKYPFADDDETWVSCIIRYRSKSGSVIVESNDDAMDAWKSGTYYDLTQYLSDGDVFYLDIDSLNEWTIMSDIPSGETDFYTLAQTHNMFNETSFTAQPLFEVNVTNDDYSSDTAYFMQVMLNGIIVRVLSTYASAHSGRPLFIDCETQDCYYVDTNGVKQNANAYVSMYSNTLSNPTTEFPVLKPGNNTFRESTGSTLYYFPMSTLMFYPRWYII